MMCGIVACRTAEPAGPFLVRALGLLEYRGYDSAGVAIPLDDGTAATLRTVSRVDAPKLKALSYRWAEHYPAGDLRHGPLALAGALALGRDVDKPRNLAKSVTVE